jgi:CRISPR-associated protein Cas1
VTTPGSFLGKASQRLVVRRERRTVCETPVERLTSVTIEGFGASLSADAVALCAAHRVPILFLSPNGRLDAGLQAPSWGDGATALAQVGALASQRPAVDLAARFVRGKVRNQINLIKYFAKHRRRRDAALGDGCRTAVEAMEGLLGEVAPVRASADLTVARGKLFSIEGRAAGFYWDVVSAVLQPRAAFPGRRREGATDLVNSMLNYGYAVLQAKVYHALVCAGLNPQVSFLHALQQGKPTLAFDAMEEFRPPIVDRTVVAILSRRQPVAIDAGGRLTDPTRRLLLAALHQRLASLVRWRGRDLTLQEIISEQAHALVKHLQGGRRYRSFASKW